MTNETTAIAERDFTLPDAQTVENRLAAIENFQRLVRQHLHEGHDYGAIPGTGGKPTLLKPGAEKITKLMGLADSYLIINEVRDWDKPLFAFTMRCRLTMIGTDVLIAEGLGECNSRESKYRYRQGTNTCPWCGKEAIIKGRADFGGGWVCWNKRGGCGVKFSDDQFSQPEQVENLDVADQVNTFVKMAKKRSLVDAALSAGRLSDIFTQDMEEQRQPSRPETSPSRAPETPVSSHQDAPSTPSSPAAAPESEEEAHGRGTDEMLVDDAPTAGRAAFMQAAAKLGYGIDDVKRILEIEQPSEIKDLGAAWDRLEAAKAKGS